MTTEPEDIKNCRDFASFQRYLISDLMIGTGLQVRIFLWFPKKLANGKWAWLRRAWKIYDVWNEDWQNAGWIYEL